MIIFLIVLASILGYAFTGAVVGSRHHAIVSRSCNLNHWGSYWCPHVMASVWLFGALWWIALPVAAGTLIGGSDKATRKERSRANEIKEAKHQAELARIRAEEDAHLTRQLEQFNTPTQGVPEVHYPYREPERSTRKRRNRRL